MPFANFLTLDCIIRIKVDFIILIFHFLSSIGKTQVTLSNPHDTQFVKIFILKLLKKLANQLGRYLRKANTNMPIDIHTNKAILFPDDAFNL